MYLINDAAIMGTVIGHNSEYSQQIPIALL
jgi:hypothetical protein